MTNYVSVKLYSILCHDGGGKRRQILQGCALNLSSISNAGLFPYLYGINIHGISAYFSYH